MKRKVLGLVEPITIVGKNSNGRITDLKIKAKVDTGASRSSISKDLVKKLNLGLYKKTTLVRSALGSERRRLVKAQVSLKGKTMKVFFSVADRRHLTHRVLIGQNMLKLGKFLVDPLK